MVLDSIENSDRYRILGTGISEALDYLKTENLETLQPGKYFLDGEKLILNVFEFLGANYNECRLEGHRKYIDLQYWVSGSELVGHEVLNNQPVLDEYNDQTDCIFYNCVSSYNRMTQRMFVVFYPTDLHTAIVDPLYTGRVKKLVFKILVEE